MIEHKDVPEHRGCNPGTNHPMVMYCEAQLNKLIAERCDCSEAEGYLCPTHAALYNKWAEFENMKLQIEELKKVCAERGSFGLKVAYDLKESDRLNERLKMRLNNIRGLLLCPPADLECRIMRCIEDDYTEKRKGE